MIRFLLSNSNFKNFFLGNIIASIGINIGIIGINWFIIDYTKQNKILGIYMAISVLSGLTASFFIGTLVDTYNKQSIMILSNIIQACLLLILSVLLFFNMNILGVIYALAVVNSIGLSIYTTSSRSFIQELLEKQNFIYGNSIIEISLQVGAIIAAGTTGLIYKYYGFKTILFVMIISLMSSCLFICKIKHTSINKIVDNENYMFRLVNGMKYLFNNKIIFLLGILSFIPYIVTLASNSVLPGYINQHLLLGSVEYGISDMLFGIGAFTSGLVLSIIIKNIKRDFLILSMFILSICSLSFLIFNKSLIGLYIAYFIFGLGNTSAKIILNTMIMELVPTHLYGRAMSLWTSISSILQVVLVLGIGYLMDIVSAIYGYLSLSVIMVLGFYFIMKILPKLKMLYIDVSVVKEQNDISFKN